MQIPYFIFLIIYIVLVSIYLFFAFFNIYHIIRFGFFDFTGKLNTLLYLGVVIVIFGMTAFLLWQVNWFDAFTVQFPELSSNRFNLKPEL